MKNEIEIKFLNIDPDKVEKKLLAIGAKKISDEVLEEWVFAKVPEWSHVLGRVRVRKEKNRTTLAYKETTKKTSEGNLEIEFEVSDHKNALAFMEKMQVPFRRHQQKRRIHYVLDSIQFDIDFWPRLPPMIEIEGDDKKELEKIAQELGFDPKDRVDLDAYQIYKRIYHIDIMQIKELVFE